MDMIFLRLKELRIERGYTQKELAAVLQTTADSIYSWEKGRSQPSIEMLSKIADFFECSIDYLTGREDDFGVITVYGAENELSAAAKEMLDIFNSLPSPYQVQVIEYARYFSERIKNTKKA